MAVPKKTALKPRRKNTGATLPAVMGASNPPTSNAQDDPPYTSAVAPKGVERTASTYFQETATRVEQTDFERKVGMDPDKLRKLFDVKNPPDPGSAIGRLKNRITALIRDGRFNNFRDYRRYAAIDLAYNVPMAQMTPTLMRTMFNRGLEGEAISQSAKDWGLAETDLYNDVETTDASGARVKKKVLNHRTFFNIFIPLVKAYVTIRLAKIYNDRNQYPFFKFEPVHYTEQARMECEMITNQVQEMATDYGFPAVLRQVILGKLLYGQQFMFPSEVWNVEMQEDNDGKEYVSREGLRYEIPHPTRTFWDLSKRVSTFNYDTGCEYAGHWRVMKFGDIQRNPNFWNKERISYGTNWFDMGLAGNFFTEVYPCVGKIYDDITMTWNQNDAAAKERMLALYNTSDNERPVFVTDLFIKLRPKDWGLSDYNYPIWSRFVVASDCDVVWAEPIPYRAVLVDLYDPNELQYGQSSLAIEVIPFQDHLGNVLSQILCSIKSNLAKVVFYDQNQVNIELAKDMKTEQRETSSILYVPFDPRHDRAAQQDISKAFLPMSFPQMNTGEQTQAIQTIITVLERLLGMSSQELGAAASHEQTATESRIINTSTSTRIDYTSSMTDEFIDCWKMQIVEASKNFADPEFLTTVTGVDEQSIDILRALGYELVGTRDVRATVKGNWSKLDYHSLVSSRDALTRINQPGVAQVMAQSIGPAAPLIAQLAGPKVLLSLYDTIAQMAGCPKDWRFVGLPMQPPQPPDILDKLKETLATNFKDLPDDAKAALLAAMLGPIGYKPGPQTVMPGVQQTQQTLQKVLPKVAAAHSQATLSAMKPLVAEVQTQQHEEMKIKAQLAELSAKFDQLMAIIKSAPAVGQNGRRA